MLLRETYRKRGLVESLFYRLSFESLPRLRSLRLGRAFPSLGGDLTAYIFRLELGVHRAEMEIEPYLVAM